MPALHSFFSCWMANLHSDSMLFIDNRSDRRRMNGRFHTAGLPTHIAVVHRARTHFRQIIDKYERKENIFLYKWNISKHNRCFHLKYLAFAPIVLTKLRPYALQMRALKSRAGGGKMNSARHSRFQHKTTRPTVCGSLFGSRATGGHRQFFQQKRIQSLCLKIRVRCKPGLPKLFIGHSAQCPTSRGKNIGSEPFG